jgi:hypothetical protein
MSKRRTFEQKHPDLNKLRVDFMNIALVTAGKEKPLVFLTQKNVRGKDLTLIFHLDTAIKTFTELNKKLRLYRRAVKLPSSTLVSGRINRDK